jgi:hypothetical protein
LSEVPVLTEKAVECAAVIKYSQVFIPIFSAFGIGIARETGTGPARANPISNTIRGQRVIIPREKALLGGGADFLPLCILPYSTVSYFTSSYLAFVETVIAGNAALLLRWRWREGKGFS